MRTIGDSRRVAVAGDLRCLCETLLERVQTEDVTGCINSTAADEFFHKALLAQMYIEKHLSPRETIAYITKHHGVLTKLSTPTS